MLIPSCITVSLVSWNRNWEHVPVLAGLSNAEAGSDAESDPMTI